MKLKYFGTAAAEGFPALYCHCDACEMARKAGGKNIRTRSQALINDDLLIDFPPDTYMHELFFGLDLRKIKHCLITHAHPDHLFVSDLCRRTRPDAHFPNNEKEPLHIYASEESGKEIKKEVELKTVRRDKDALRYSDIEPYEEYKIGDYTVTPLRAVHAPGLDALIFIISQGEKTILYAHDTGYFCEEVWSYLEKNKIHLNLVSLDCTLDIGDKYENHMGFDTCLKVRERLLKANADNNTVFIINHFSHNCGVIYDEFVPTAKKENFLVSYDGFEVEI